MTGFRGLTSTLGFVIFMTIWTLKHSINRYFLSNNIICKKVTTPTTNVFKSPARFSSYKGSGYVAALVIISYFVDRSCSSSRFSNNSAFNYNHVLLSSLYSMYTLAHLKLSGLNWYIILETLRGLISLHFRSIGAVYDRKSVIKLYNYTISYCFWIFV